MFVGSKKLTSKQTWIETKLTTSKNDCVALIKHHISPSILKNLLKNITSSFAIFINQYNFINGRQILCVMIKYFNERKKKFMTYFYRLIEIKSNNYINELIISMTNDKLKMNNFFGVGIDGMNVKDFEDIIEILREKNSKIVINKYLPQSFNTIIMQAANSKGARWINFFEFLINYTYQWFDNVKHQNIYQDVFQKIKRKLNRENWEKSFSNDELIFQLSHVKTISDMWDDLKQHFEVVYKQEGCYLAKKLFDMYNTTDFKICLKCYHDVLEKIKEFINSFLHTEPISDPRKYFEFSHISDI